MSPHPLAVNAWLEAYSEPEVSAFSPVVSPGLQNPAPGASQTGLLLLQTGFDPALPAFLLPVTPHWEILDPGTAVAAGI